MSHRSPITCIDHHTGSDRTVTGGYDGRVVGWARDEAGRWQAQWSADFDDLVNDVRIDPTGTSVAVSWATRPPSATKRRSFCSEASRAVARGEAAFTRALGRVPEALEHYTIANQLDLDYIDPYWNSAVNHLAMGNLREGYRLYEWRWKTDAQKDQYQHFDQPLWKGEPLEGRKRIELG